MDDESQNNKILEESADSEEYEFKYNFITLPWDDRSRQSKVGIVFLLVSLTVCILACVINGLAMHYRGYNDPNKDAVSCHRIRYEDYPHVARIVSVSSKKIMLCVGAMVKPDSVLAHSDCVKPGIMKLQLGSLSNPRCRKGFMVEHVQSLKNISENLVLLTTFDDTAGCRGIVQVGKSLNMKSPAYIIGGTLESPRNEIGSLSRQSVALIPCNAPMDVDQKGGPICVKNSVICPIKQGDILLQNSLLYGVALTSSSNNKNNFISFVNVSLIRDLIYLK